MPNDTFRMNDNLKNMHKDKENFWFFSQRTYGNYVGTKTFLVVDAVAS